MSKSESYEAKTEELIQPLIDSRGFELVDVEFVKEGSDWYLRVYIDKDGEKYLASKKSLFPYFQFDADDFYIYDGEKEVGEVDKEYFIK